MAGDLSQFIVGLDAWGAKVREDVAKTVRQLAFAIDRELVLRTPVGNPELWAANRGKKRGDRGFVGRNYTGGRARANWLPSLDVPSDATVDQPDPSGTQTMARMGQVTARFRLGQRIWISNNLDYIQRLNEGHSTQAPAGFVEAAIQVGTRTVLKR